MRLKLLVGLLCFAPAVWLGPACFKSASSVALGMRAPQGLLDSATSIELTVVERADESGVDCAGPSLTGTPQDDAVQVFDLQHGGCVSGAPWCREITVDKDDTRKVFYVRATSPAGPLAEGCVSVVVDQDPLEVNITVERFNPPKCCNDGILEPGEQCDFGASGAPQCGGILADAVCDADCQANEILLTVDNPSPPFPNVANKLVNGPVGAKVELALSFSGTSGATMPGSLRALYTDHYNATGGADIDLRVLDSKLYPIPVDAPGTLRYFSGQVRMPAACPTLTTVAGTINAQQTPALANVAADTTVGVYASDEVQKNRFDIWAAAFTDAGCTAAAPVQVNSDTSTSATDPDVATGPLGTALIVWRSGIALHGRLRNPDGSFTPAAADIDLGTIADGARPRVAGSPNGWIVVRAGVGDADPDAVVMTRVSNTGALGTSTRVNAKTGGIQDKPDVAVMPDGRTCVVWRSDGVIMFQRFTASGAPLAEDQLTPLQRDAPPPSDDPVIDDAGDFFVAAWTASNGTIWGRYIGGTDSFGYNPVTGQNGDFKVSHPAIELGLGTGGQRSRPAIAVDTYIAFGWQDLSPEHHGLFVRRFPLPQAQQ